jgi:hypothetical protein
MKSCRGFPSITKTALAVIVLSVFGMGQAPSSTVIQIADVFGLANSLAVRPTMGAGYSIGRTAIVNASGQIDAAAGNLGDCVHVDGSSGPCALSGGSNGPNFADNETPVGSINGVNQTFTLQTSPVPPVSLHLYANGLRLKTGADYTVSGNIISFIGSYTPGLGDTVLADYRY